MLRTINKCTFTKAKKNKIINFPCLEILIKILFILTIKSTVQHPARHSNRHHDICRKIEKKHNVIDDNEGVTL